MDSIKKAKIFNIQNELDYSIDHSSLIDKRVLKVCSDAERNFLDNQNSIRDIQRLKSLNSKHDLNQLTNFNRKNYLNDNQNIKTVNYDYITTDEDNNNDQIKMSGNIKSSN